MKAGVKVAWSWNADLAAKLLRESLPLIFSGIAIMLYMKVDQIMLGEMRGDRDVGIYTAATRLSEMWYFIAAAVVSSSFPAIVSSKALGGEIYMLRMKKLFRALAAMAWCIAIFNTLFANQLIQLIFGSSYTEAAPVLAIHTWATLAVFMGIARESWIVSEGLGRFLMYATLSGAVVNIVMNLILIPTYGPVGAALATTVAYTAAVFVAPFFYKRTKHIGRMMLIALIPISWRHV
jgi:PST family polysaccharide transporter